MAREVPCNWTCRVYHVSTRYYLALSFAPSLNAAATMMHPDTDTHRKRQNTNASIPRWIIADGIMHPLLSLQFHSLPPKASLSPESSIIFPDDWWKRNRSNERLWLNDDGTITQIVNTNFHACWNYIFHGNFRDSSTYFPDTRFSIRVVYYLFIRLKRKWESS